MRKTALFSFFYLKGNKIKMFYLKFDKQHNLLTIKFSNYFDIQQGELLSNRLEQELAKVKKGFMIVTDLSDLAYFDIACSPYIKQMMILCNSHGVSRIFRIIPDKTKDIGFNIMSLFHYSKDVKIHTYKTLEEASYYVRINSKITFTDKILTILKILKIKSANLSEHPIFRYFVIISGFIILIILRQLFKAFGVSLGYLYITLIALSGFWFGIKGGIITALSAFIIFTVEVNIFSLWIARDIVLKTMIFRLLVYFLSGIAIGHLSQSEKKIRKKLEFLAGQDELTGFFNFRFTLELLKKEIERCKRYRKNLTVAVIDIDNFKDINDNYGHLVGNDSLQALSNTIKNNLRETDIAGRYGGDEFLLIFPESTCEQGREILTRIKTLMSNFQITSSFLLHKNTISLTFSAGLASFSPYNKTMDALINSADKALYQAKKEGKNRISIHKPTDN